MSYLYNKLQRERDSNQILLDFFFSARGDELQRDPTGMLRSLLNQLFQQDLEAREPLRAAYREQNDRSGGRASATWQLQRYELEALLLDSLVLCARNHQVIFFIDALDEAGEKSAREVARYFHRVSDQIVTASLSAKLCISSRHYPIASATRGLEVWMESHNGADISAFIHDRLNLDDRTTDDTPDLEQWNTMKAELVQRAHGVFQWVRLVVDILEQYLNAGDSLEDARQHIEQVPEELEAVYEHIIRNVIEVRHRPQSLRLFQWVCLARRPLSVNELRYALAACNSTPSLHGVTTRCEQTRSFIKTDELMKLRLKAFSGGLVEVAGQTDHTVDESNAESFEHTVGNNKSVVQIIHQSVNDFLLNCGLELLTSMQSDITPTLPSLEGNPPESTIISHSHAQIYWSCLNYLSSENPETLERGTTQSEEGDSLSFEEERPEKALPFMDYACNHVFDHAKKASTARLTRTKTQAELIELVLPRWDKYITSLPFVGLGQHNTPLHVAAGADMTDLIEQFIFNGIQVDTRNGESLTALHVAARAGHETVVKALVHFGADIDAVVSAETGDRMEDATPLALAARGGHLSIVKWLLEFRDERGERKCGLAIPLSLAAESGKFRVVKTLIDAGADPNITYGKYSTPLQAAAHRGCCDIVQLLLAAGADVNIVGGRYGSALMAACNVGDLGIARTLLDAGADVNARTNGREGYALQEASANGNPAVVKLLLARGAKVNLEGGLYGYPLHAACATGRVEIVRYLLAAGADVNARRGNYGSPLQLATYQPADKSVALMKLLLEGGADVNAVGEKLTTALHTAIRVRCHRTRGLDFTKTIKVLLSAEADINARDADGKTVLDYARYYKSDLLEFLLQRGAIHSWAD